MRPRLACPHCGRDVEDLPYCGNCGRSLRRGAAGGGRGPAGRVAGLVEAARAGRVPLVPAALALGGMAVLLLLLADLPGQAIAVAATVLPVAVAGSVARQDVFEREPWVYLLAAGAAGFVGGALVALLGTFLLDRFWLGDTVFNVGAAGFAGAEADGEGSAPALVLLLAGLMVPIAALAATLVGPLALRRLPMFRNETMDGVGLGVAAGGGFAAASALVYYWPYIVGGDARGDVADWVATLIGLVLLRPIIFGAAAGMTAAAVWHYALHGRPREVLVPLLAGVGGLAAYSLGVLLAMPVGLRVELLWGLVTAAALGLAGSWVTGWARAEDRRMAAGSTGRVVCPNCRRPTPAGDFCANCGRPLPRLAPVAPAPGDPPVAAPGDAPPEAAEEVPVPRTATAPDGTG